MKKLFLITITMLLLTGCGKTKEEKEDMLYSSLEKAFMAVYSAEGAGLPVTQSEEEMKEFDGQKWYKVSVSEYANIEKLLDYSNSVYVDKISKKLNEELTEKYRQSGGELYTLSQGGCPLDYMYEPDLKDLIKEDVKIKKIKSKKIVFEYKNKEFTATMEDDNYKFDKKIFECAD